MTSSVPLWCTRLNHIAMGILASSRAQLPHRTTVVQGETIYSVLDQEKSYESDTIYIYIAYTSRLLEYLIQSMTC